MNDVAVHVKFGDEKWWVWVNKSRFMGFRSEGDAVGVGRRLADIIAELVPVGTRVTYTPVTAKTEQARKAGA